MTTAIARRIEHRASVYLTDVPDRSMEEMEDLGAEAATESLVASRVAFADAMRAAGLRADGKAYDASAFAAYEAATDAAEAAIARHVPWHHGWFVTLGWH